MAKRKLCHPEWYQPSKRLEVLEPTPRDFLRFFGHVAKDGDCWIWDGFKSEKGNGQFWWRGRNEQAHRWAFAAFNAVAITESLEVHHECECEACVNPKHLKLKDPFDHRELHEQQSCEVPF